MSNAIFKNISRLMACLWTVAMLLSYLCPVAMADELSRPEVTSGCHTLDAAMPLVDSKILKTTNAAIVYEMNSETLVYAYNPDERIYPSSMVKLMTAIVALEYGNMSDMVTVRQDALKKVTSSAVNVKLVDGETLSLEQLMYCMMVASANDAAVVIAQYVGGTYENFIELMNQKAIEIGCRDTHYGNAHGLHDEQTYTTARDICKILKYGLEDPVFKEMFTRIRYTVPPTNRSPERTMRTTNNLMWDNPDNKYYDDRVDGGKTGSTDAAGRCLAITTERNDMNFMCLVMGAKASYAADGYTIERYGHFEEMLDLMDYAYGRFAYRQIFNTDQIIGQYSVANGACDVATRPVDNISTVLPENIDQTQITWIYEHASSAITAPVAAGQTISTVRAMYGEICIGQTQLVAVNDVPVESSPVMTVRPSVLSDQGSWQTLLAILGIILGIAIVVAAAMFGPGLIRTWLRRAKRRRRIINRRRNRR